MNIGGLPGALNGLTSGTTIPAQAGAGSGGTQQASDAFGGILNSLTGAQDAADKAVTNVALGSDQDLHDAVLSVQMESLSFDLAVQVRNRLVDAYQETFRMSV